MPPKPRQVRIESKSAMAAMQQLESRSDEELEKETRFKSAAQAILGTRAAERMDANQARDPLPRGDRRRAPAGAPAAAPDGRGVAGARRAPAGDLKAATEKLGGPPPTNRQLLMLRVMGVILPPKSAGLAAPDRRHPADLPRDRVLLILGFGIVKLIALPFGGIGATAWFYGFLLILVVLAVMAFIGRRRQRTARAKIAEQRAAAIRRQAVAHTSGSPRVTAGVLPPFWTLVETHGDELLAHARRLAGDAQAEDVLQDALLRALRAYPRLRHAEHLRAWLYRVTTSAAIDHHRRRRQEVPTDDPPVVATHDHYDDGAFESLIEPLNETAQTALRLRFVDDLDYDGIAARLGCSTVAARQRVSTAVRTLRESYA